MDKESWNALDILYQSEKRSLDIQIEQKIKEEFSNEERRIHEALMQQTLNAESSKAYGSKESVEKARASAEASFERGNALIHAKIEQRTYELNKIRDEGLDRIYQYDGGCRFEAEQSHLKWLDEQAKSRNEKDDTNTDTRLDKSNTQEKEPSNISPSESNEKSTMRDQFNRSTMANEDFDLDK